MSELYLNRKMTGARAIVKCLKIHGIEKVFCVPGESYLPLLDALYDEPTIQLISARHEGGAAFMAEGYAKAANKPAAVLATRGVGAGNLSIGVHTAFQDSTPMVIFIGQVHSKFRGREGFQEVDLVQFFKPIAKWAVEIDTTDRIPELVQRAIRVAISGRPGPVVISLPEDILPAEAEMHFSTSYSRPKPAPSSKEINEVEKVLQIAKSPLIIAGGGVRLSEAEEELVEFSDKYSIPVVTAFRRHDVFPHNHRLFAGHLGLGTDNGILQSVRDADVIIAIGTRLSEITTQDYQLISPEQKLVHIDISEETLGKIFSPTVGIISDVKEALVKLMTIDIKAHWEKWALDRNKVYKNTAVLNLNESDHVYSQVMDVLMKKLPKSTILTNDAGNFAGWLHRYYSFQMKQTYIGPTSGAMGYGMPAAIGAKLANMSRTVMSLSGDGGFMMTFQELETAVRYNIPIISLVFNNKMYGTIRMYQEIHYPSRVIGTDLGNVSFKSLAESLGAIGYCVRTRDEFEKSLDYALTTGHPTVIEILADKEQISVTQTITDIRKMNKK